MADFKVTWEIDLVAETPEDAARQALAIQRDPKSLATVFDVIDNYTMQEPERIDLIKIDQERSIEDMGFEYIMNSKN